MHFKRKDPNGSLYISWALKVFSGQNTKGQIQMDLSGK